MVRPGRVTLEKRGAAKEEAAQSAQSAQTDIAVDVFGDDAQSVNYDPADLPF